MKLLKKSEIHSAKANDLRKEAEEGIKLARRVDALRETQAEEEVSLKRFRETTIATVYAETQKASAERDQLIQEVTRLQKDREEALRPITEEQEAFEKAREDLEAKKRDQEHEQERLDILREYTEHDAKNAREELHRAENEHKRSSALLSQTDQKEREAENTLAKAHEVLTSSLAVKQTLDIELEIHRAQATATENRQDKRDKDQDKREKELNKRETQLTDREQTLLRTIKRYG